jgi:DNA ligase-1
VIEKFGPVRRVIPTLVFEIAFEGLSRSTRHKSGIAVRFPRILRWRTDKTPEQADSIQTLHALLLQADTTDDAAVNESAADGGGR